MILVTVFLLSMFSLVKSLDGGLFTPENVYVEEPYCGPVVWNGYGMMVATYKSCMLDLLSSASSPNTTINKREVLSSIVASEVLEYLDLYNVSESFFEDLLQVPVSALWKRTDGVIPPGLPSSVHRDIVMIVKHTTSSSWWRMKQWLKDVSINIFHYLDTGSSLVSTGFTIASYFKSSDSVSSCASVVRLVAKNGALTVPSEQGGTSDPNNPAYFYAHIKPRTSNKRKCDTASTKELQAAVEDALDSFTINKSLSLV